MGQILNTWEGRVAQLLRDAGNQDLAVGQIDDVGIRPALARYSTDRPRVAVAELVGTGSPYLDLPTEWVAGFSRLEAVEFPARENPPAYLDDHSYRTVRKVSDVAVEQILLGATPVATQFVRLTFTAPWPMPTATAADDKVDDVAFYAVTALAASYCCMHLAAEASRDRAGALSTVIVQGRDRAESLRRAADRYEAVYNSYLGLGGSSDQGGERGSGGSRPPAHRRLDSDPSRGSLFHGGRR